MWAPWLGSGVLTPSESGGSVGAATALHGRLWEAVGGGVLVRFVFGVLRVLKAPGAVFMDRAESEGVVICFAGEADAWGVDRRTLSRFKALEG